MRHLPRSMLVTRDFFLFSTGDPHAGWSLELCVFMQRCLVLRLRSSHGLGLPNACTPSVHGCIRRSFATQEPSNHFLDPFSRILQQIEGGTSVWRMTTAAGHDALRNSSTQPRSHNELSPTAPLWPCCDIFCIVKGVPASHDPRAISRLN